LIGVAFLLPLVLPFFRRWAGFFCVPKFWGWSARPAILHVYRSILTQNPRIHEAGPGSAAGYCSENLVSGRQGKSLLAQPE
jgi:hypothetical protein